MNWNATIENCVNAGKNISLAKGITGNIVGCPFFNENTSLTNCYWIDDTNYNNLHTINDSEIIIKNIHEIELNIETIDKLNDYAEKNDCDKWLFNPNNYAVTL